jgi:hypothetical protein
VYFSGVDLLLSMERDPDEALRARLHQHFETLQGHRSQVISDVHRTEALLASLGHKAPPPPREPDEFYRWRGQLLSAVSTTLQAAAPKQAACHLTGHIIGDAWDTVNLGGLTYGLLAVAPAHPRLLAQAEALARAQEQVLTRLDRAVAHPLWEPAEQEALAAVRTGIGALPSFDPSVSPEVAPADRLLTLTEAMRALSDRIGVMQQVLP